MATRVTTVTIEGARKRLAAALEKGEAEVRVRPAGLGHRVHNLEAGLREAKRRAVRQARQLVEVMEARQLTRVDRLVLRGNDLEDQGYSVVYLSGSEVLLVQHSSMDQAGLGEGRRAALDRYLSEVRG